MRAYSEREGGEYDRRVEQSLLKKQKNKKHLTSTVKNQRFNSLLPTKAPRLLLLVDIF